MPLTYHEYEAKRNGEVAALAASHHGGIDRELDQCRLPHRYNVSGVPSDVARRIQFDYQVAGWDVLYKDREGLLVFQKPTPRTSEDCW